MPVDLGHCLLVSVTKFQYEFASLQQVNVQVKFQNMLYKYVFDKITDEFCGILRVLWIISRDFVELPEIHDSATSRNIRSPEFTISV